MNFLSSYKLSAIAGILLVLVFVSCEQDAATIGAGVIGGEPFITGQQSFDVFAYNKKIKTVNTNRMPIYQLGTFNDPVYGKTQASITAQLRLSAPNPIFGNFAQATEDNAENDGSITTVQENERVVSVFLNIPYLVSDASLRDRDGDGVDDEFDLDADDPNSDWDDDGISDLREKTTGTNPFSNDTDGDGILDPDDTDMKLNIYPKRFDLDSIYGNREAPVKVKVERSTYFLRDLDPNANFEEAQAYFSDQEFSPTFVSEVLNDGDGEFVISDMEYIELQEDDPDTEVDEGGDLENRYAPGIRIPLDKTFFEQNILDKEGSSELLSQANFSEFFRGVHLSVESDEIMFLLDLKQANITIKYAYDSVNSDGVSPTNPKEEEFQLLFLQTQNATTIGNAANTFLNDEYPSEISGNLDTDENASRLYLKGGAGSYAEIKLFGEDEAQANAVIEQIKANNWVINEANLVFYVDQASLPVGMDEPPRLYVYNADTNEFLFDAATDPIGVTSLSSYLQYDGLLREDPTTGIKKYTVRITKYINDIILRDAENATLAVTLTPNINLVGAAKAMLADPDDGEKNIPVASWLTPLGTVLYGNQVTPQDQANKLELEVFYTQSN